MDVLDELNGKIEELCAIAERERDRILDELCEYLPVEFDQTARQIVADFALDYATWVHALDGYRRLLRERAGAPIARVK